jgi:hypothetical protein
LLGATNHIETVQDHAKLKFAHDFTDTLQLSYTFGLWQNDAERDSDTWLRDAAGAPVYADAVNLDGRVYTIGATEMGPSNQQLTHLMHGLSLRRRRAGNWDFEVAASLYDYDEDETRSPSVPMPAAASGGEGRIADQSGTGWSTLALRASWHGERAGGGHFVELGIQDDRYHLRSEVFATNDWLRGGAGGRVAAFRGDTGLTRTAGSFRATGRPPSGCASNTGAPRMAQSPTPRRPGPSNPAPTLIYHPSSRCPGPPRASPRSRHPWDARYAFRRSPSCIRARSRRAAS